MLYSQSYWITWDILVDPVNVTANTSKHWIQIGGAPNSCPTRDPPDDPTISFKTIKRSSTVTLQNDKFESDKIIELLCIITKQFSISWRCCLARATPIRGAKCGTRSNDAMFVELYYAWQEQVIDHKWSYSKAYATETIKFWSIRSTMEIYCKNLLLAGCIFSYKKVTEFCIAVLKIWLSILLYWKQLKVTKSSSLWTFTSVRRLLSVFGLDHLPEIYYQYRKERHKTRKNSRLDSYMLIKKGDVAPPTQNGKIVCLCALSSKRL